MKVGWLDLSAGAAGDMLLAAALDAGAPFAAVRSAVDGLGLPEVTLTTRRTTRAGLAALHLEVVGTELHPPRRRWRDVDALLRSAELPDDVRRRALAVFGRLARAEAAVHGIDPADVHFHEVGAVDALADVVGTCAGLCALELDVLVAGPVTVGSGRTSAAHGSLPVPAPATLELLREAGAPVAGGWVDGEACTPTGAALLAEWVQRWGALPEMRVDRVGVGAGTRDPADLPNVVRLVVGTCVDVPDTAVLLESNVDDLDPRLWPAVLTRLLEAGASDAWLTPILMKKGRPAHTVHVLAPASRAATLREVVFAETTAIGLRESTVSKHALDRHVVTVEVGGEPVRVKVARLGERVVNAMPEYDDVAIAAEHLQWPVKVVLAAAQAEAQRTVASLSDASGREGTTPTR